jgi:hypothetical protein
MRLITRDRLIWGAHIAAYVLGLSSTLKLYRLNIRCPAHLSNASQFLHSCKLESKFVGKNDSGSDGCWAVSFIQRKVTREISGLHIRDSRMYSMQWSIFVQSSDVMLFGHGRSTCLHASAVSALRLP